MNQRIKHRDYFVVQVRPEEIADTLRCDEFEAAQRTSVGGMTLPVVYVVRDEFDDDPIKPRGLWFESPLTAKAAIDIHCYGEGFQKTFWPSYHDVYIAMRNCPSILKAFQELHRDAVEMCSDGLLDESDFAFTVRERLGRCFTEIEFNLSGKARGSNQGG